MQNYTSRNILILFAIACGLFMENIDATIITTSVPVMAQSLHADPVSLKLALTSYILSLAVFVPVSGWIAERFGCKLIFTLSFAVFISGSFLCGLSNSLTQLVIYRVIQGIGGALMVPVGTLMTLKIFGTENYLRVINFIVIPSLIGPVIGPVIGGLISYNFNWHWIFFVNIPIGIIAIFLVIKFIPNDLSKVKVEAINIWGFLFFTIGLTGINIFLNLVDEKFFKLNQMLLVLMISIISIILYLINNKTTTNPIWNLTIFKIRTFRVTNIGSLITRLGIGGIPFLLPLFFEYGLHYNAYQAGLFLFPMALGMLFAKFIIRKLLELLGFKRMLIYNTMALGINIMSFAFIDSNSNLITIIIFLILF
ncbi:MAG: MFS transporter, partial [Burkholderiales bacterium]|nr:MFS transporter [Burkholderiales bacterium]